MKSKEADLGFIPKTSFGKAAMELDTELHQFETFVKELTTLPLDTDKGYERSLVLLTELASCRVRMETAMRGLGTSLNEVRRQNEEAERVVAERTVLVEERKAKVDQMYGRLHRLGEVVKELNSAMGRLKDQAKLELSEQDQADIASTMPGLESQLDIIVNETQSLVEDAKKTQLKSLEREADSLWKSLSTVRNRLKLFMENKISPLDVN